MNLEGQLSFRGRGYILLSKNIAREIGMRGGSYLSRAHIAEYD